MNAPEAAVTRTRALQALQQLVDACVAFWRVNDDGELELHLSDGAVFLLLENGIKRLR